MLDLRQTSEYAKYMKAIGWIVDGKLGSFAYIKKFPIIGSFIKIQRPEIISDKAIMRLSKKYRAFQIVIEPKSTVHGSLLTEHGFHQSRSYFVPSKTIHIDLTSSERRLLTDMHYKTRYNIKKAMSNKLQVTSSKDIDGFANFWQKCAREQRGMFLSMKKEMTGLYNAFRKNAYIITVSRHPERPEGVEGSHQSYRHAEKNNLLSGILLIHTKDIAYYMYAASTVKGKKLFAPTLNAWEAIKLSKKLGCKVFDFEGIYDDRFPIKSWLGFTRFKRSFGGNVIGYPGTYHKFLLPFRLFR